MTTFDWIVLFLTLASIVLYGIYKGRGSKNIQGYLLADRKMKWYVIAFSIMATQASAITFTSTPGQAFVDGMRFVQFYFGLPLAMVILAVTAVPIFHKLGVYTAYEYLEHRFDLKTRVLTSLIFLVSRGLAVGITIYAPSIILSVMLGWDIRITSTLIGGAIIIYTTTGGVKSVSWTHVQQMFIIMSGMLIAFIIAVSLLPEDVSFFDALRVAGASGKLNAVDFTFDLDNRYNFWSGLIGGMFVALAYFGTDQSQVQRYLTGQSVTESRMGLLLNGMLKVPMQFFILLLGVLVFVFYQFEKPPLVFNPVETQAIAASEYSEVYRQLEEQYDDAFHSKQSAIQEYLAARQSGNEAATAEAKQEIAAANSISSSLRLQAAELLQKNGQDSNDTNYIFLSFVLKYLPTGLVGLLFACIFAATMSSTSGELSALASSTIIDVYKRLFNRTADEKHYLVVSRAAMALWGVYGIAFAQFASQLGTLVEAVNIIGSLFYGTMLGVFLLAFYFKRVGGTATFIAAFVGEAAVFSCFMFTDISWLWYNVVGCGVVVGGAVLLNPFLNTKASPEKG
ncbi:MAG: sodium:solute symporter [Ignavibacteriae bacterium]|nr:sodium:solute symporter [Ignavibacteriota bacterium]